MLPICNSADDAICSGPPEGDRVQLMVVRVVNYVREVNVDRSRSDLCSRCARRVQHSLKNLCADDPIAPKLSVTKGWKRWGATRRYP